MKIKLFITFFCCILSGCAKTFIVAPADSYVCYATNNDCDNSPRATSWEEFDVNSTKLLKNPKVADIIVFSDKAEDPRNFILDDIVSKDDLCGEISRKDLYTKEKMDDDSVFASGLRAVASNSCVVFQSPILVSQWEEDMLKLEYSIDACNRVKSAIEMQLTMLSVADEISPYMQLTEEAITKASAGTYRKNKVISDEEKDELITNKADLLRGKEYIRTISKQHKISVELLEQMKDAILKVMLAEKSLARTRFYMDEVRFQSCSSGKQRQLFQNNTWVTKGTKVLEIEN